MIRISTPDKPGPVQLRKHDEKEQAEIIDLTWSKESWYLVFYCIVTQIIVMRRRTKITAYIWITSTTKYHSGHNLQISFWNYWNCNYNRNYLFSLIKYVLWLFLLFLLYYESYLFLHLQPVFYLLLPLAATLFQLPEQFL